ncbi:TadE/TadG family type IV pilus assembly protein [Nocardioides sp. SR21]|uniref:TadE/TadG family type IV pilus assembly protein n=1 Tax=Nocardioides sp. SR21 TaxID=2919501 RepID=UPI001FA9B0A9|nr:TadE family protein [Nocardioides sp. SR21]
MKVRLNRRRDEGGAAAVEFALVVLPFVTLVFGAIDFGWAINNDVMVNNAAREGAREGSLNANAAAIQAEALASYSGSGTPIVTVSCRNAAGGACSLASAAPGDTVIVTVKVQHDWITPIGSLFDPDGKTLSKTAEMRIE